MNVRQSILGEIATPSGRTISAIDVGGLVRRLLLFDRVVIKSFVLKELPVLIQAFGRTGFAALMEVGLLQFTFPTTAVIVEVALNGVRRLPLDHFSFGTGQVIEIDKKARSGLQFLQGIPGLKSQERAGLEERIWKSILWQPSAYSTDLLSQADQDVRSNTPALRAALAQRIPIELGRPGPILAKEIALEVEEPSTRVFHLKNSLSASFGFSPEKTHELLKQAVTAATNLNTRLADMQAFSAITGFAANEAPLLFGKLAGLMAPLNPKIGEAQFQRVIELAGIPDFNGQRVNVELLMKARDSAECREFREWLVTLTT
jgi:hypothetical protein